MSGQIERQIFIGGCSRSGTTLLGAMLGTHSACVCTPESHFKTSLLRGQDLDIHRIDPRAVFNRVRGHWRYKIWEMDLPLEDLPGGLDTTYAGLLNWIAGEYARRVGEHDAHIWVDHTPLNISYGLTLLEIFPAAKLVHIVRDGRAAAASILPLDWGPNSIIHAAHWWVEQVGYGLAVETLLGPDRVIRVRYEDLVRAPEQTLSALCDFAGIDYHPQMLLATGFRPPRYTSSQHTMIGKRPDPARIDKWAERLTPRQVEIFENVSRDFLSYLGYEPRYGLAAREPRVLETVGGALKELVRGGFTNRVRWLIRAYPLWVSPEFFLRADMRN